MRLLMDGAPPQIGGSLGTIGQVAHHQHGPLIADQLQRSRDRTTITCTSSHGLLEFRVSGFEFEVLSFDVSVSVSVWRLSQDSAGKPKISPKYSDSKLEIPNSKPETYSYGRKLILYVLIFEFSVVGFIPKSRAARD